MRTWNEQLSNPLKGKGKHPPYPVTQADNVLDEKVMKKINKIIKERRAFLSGSE